MPPRTLRSRTARSSLILLRENLKDLRAYAEDFDPPQQTDRLVKNAELTSTTIKKLLAWLEPEETPPASAGDDGDLIDVVAVRAFLCAMDRLCPVCGGRLPPSGTNYAA